jgi:hypothetical protein
VRANYKMGPKNNKSTSSKVAVLMDSISTNESGNDSDLNTDLFPDNTLNGSPGISGTITGITTGITDADSSVGEKRFSDEIENSTEETDRDRRKRLKSTSLQATIQASLVTERQASVAEITALKSQVATMVAAQAKFMEDFTVKSQATPTTGFGYFENVTVLETVAEVTQSRVDSVISQFRNPNFSKPILEIIQKKAKKYIDHMFMSHGYAEDDDVISLWTKEEYVDNLEKLFHNSHFDTTTLNRFGKIDFKLLYVAGKLSPKLCNQVFELTANMLLEEVNDVQFQRSLINRAFYLLSPNEPVRIQLTASVNACKTFEDYFMFWSRYKVKKQGVVDDLVIEGYNISPKVYLMAGKDSLGNAGKSDKPVKTPKGTFTDIGRAPVNQVPLDSQYVSCDNCGRQEFDKKQNVVHTVDNCYLKNHEDRNTNHNIRWKDSSSGKAFAALTPPWNVLPFGLRKDGSKRIMAPKGSISCSNCDYLVSLKNNFLKFSSNINFLPITMISIQLPTMGTISLNAKEINLRGLLDSGSLAGDFVSQDVIENFNLNSYIKLDKSSKKIC